MPRAVTRSDHTVRRITPGPLRPAAVTRASASAPPAVASAPAPPAGASAPAPPAGVGVPAAGVVLGAIRRAGAPFRDEVVTATGLSHATVSRQVVALIEAGLVRDRPDLVRPGTVGRPRIPIEIDEDRFAVLGLHVGLHRTTLSVGNLRGTVLAASEVPTPREADPADALGTVSDQLLRLRERFEERCVLQVGLVVGGQLSGERDRLGHRRLGWDTAPIADVLGRVALPDVVLVPQVEAVAGAESLLSPHVDEGSTLHVYAREAVGAVLTVDGRVHAPTAGPGTISHLPCGTPVPCPCGRTGCLEVSVGDAGVARSAHEAGVVDQPVIEKVVAAAEEGSRPAHELLARRARALGRGVAIVRDVLNPDRVVLAGQAFTAYRPGLAHVSQSFSRSTALPPMSLQVTSFGPALQAVAACTAALRPIYADPLGLAARRCACGSCPTSRRDRSARSPRRGPPAA